MRIIKYALPLAAMVSLGTLSVSAKDSGSRSGKSSSSESGTRKKSSSSKKSSKARKAKSSKAKSREGAGKGSKVEGSAVGTAAWHDWADRLPPEELPQAEDATEDDEADAGTEP
jgi:hypothetical protein